MSTGHARHCLSVGRPVDNSAWREGLWTTDGVAGSLHMVRGVTPPSSRSAITRLGGVATWTELIADVGRVGLRRALDSGSIIRVGRGRYVAAATSEHRSRAHSLTGLVSHLSAAVHHGWKVKCVPAEAWVTVPRTRHVRAAPEGVRIHWADLPADEASAGVTHPLRTVLDCARVLPFDEALALADSALRSGTVSKEDLARLRRRRPGPARHRSVASRPTPMAAPPTRSSLCCGRSRSRPASISRRSW